VRFLRALFLYTNSFPPQIFRALSGLGVYSLSRSRITRVFEWSNFYLRHRRKAGMLGKAI